MKKRKRRSDSKKYTAHGKTLTIREWAEELGVTLSCLRKRLASGMTAEDAFTGDKRYPGGYIGSEKKRYFASLERKEYEKELNRTDDEEGS